jgi:hypothetical protein
MPLSKEALERLDLIADQGVALSLSKEPVMRAFGRIVASDVLQATTQVIRDEQRAGTPPEVIAAAMAMFAATAGIGIAAGVDEAHKARIVAAALGHFSSAIRIITEPGRG